MTRKSAQVPFASIVLLAVIASISVHAFYSAHFFREHAFAVNDVFFDADPPNVIGHIFGNRLMMFRHPLILFFSFPFFLAASFSSKVTHLDLLTLAVVFVSPVASGVKTLFLALTARVMGCPLWAMALLLLIDLFSFSQLVFGSIPESFPLTAAGLVILTYLAGRTLTGTPSHLFSWVIIGTLLAGITVSNLAFLPLIMFPTLIGTSTPWLAAVRRSAIATVLSGLLLCALVGVSYVVIHPTRNSESSSSRTRQGTETSPANTSGKSVEVGQVDLSSTVSYMRFSPAAVIASIPKMITYGFTGPRPFAFRDNRVNVRADAPKVAFRMPQDAGRSWMLPMLLVLASLCAGIAGWWVKGGWRVGLILQALLVIGFQLALSSVWGAGEIFLYILHLQPMLLILLLGIFRFQKKLVFLLPATLLVLEIVQNYNNLRFMLMQLSS